MAVSHDMALNLEASDLRKVFDEGRFPNPRWEKETRSAVDQRAQELKNGMLSALITTFILAAIGLSLTAIFGKVHPALPLDWGKILSVFGGLLAACATLFELGGYTRTFGGESLHENLRPVFFRAVFLPGLVIATAGQLWWQ